MTRKVVAIEGKQYLDGRLFLPGSLIPVDGSILVIKHFDVSISGSKNMPGKATDFERNDDTGEISFNIIMRDELPEDLNAHVFLTHITCSEILNDGAMVIDSAIIREIYLSKDQQGWSDKE